MAQRKAITTAQAKAWTKATKAEKAAILDAGVQVTGWHRDHARKMLRRGIEAEEVAEVVDMTIQEIKEMM